MKNSTKENEKPIQPDDVLRRMLATPPQPNVKPKPSAKTADQKKKTGK